MGFFLPLFAELSHLGGNFQIMRLFVKSRDGLAVLEENHGRTFLVGVPQLGDLGVILALHRNHRQTVRQQGFGAQDIFLNGRFSIGVVNVDQDRLVFGKLGEDLVHVIVLGH